MLKRLELVGFKSFADKTAFDFSQGITGVVGPNGSGKSNIVDAVRWVLGEQSAKSLRGGEMTDVIFNGSASRRSLGMAEVTMTFDNSRKQLATEAEEVQITRRVYRSGEGEYLINQHVCRLKDIKNLFLGSGAGSSAYCIIEQGRVDVLLQASTKERRTIFEEAAGISRFKAKKMETLRKLERVEHNLQRLRDILEEVEKQLRSVKLQAAKAQRYKEYSERLRELRLEVSLSEYRELDTRLQAEMAVLRELQANLSDKLTQADASERVLHQLEASLTQLETTIHEQETELASTQQTIAAEHSTLSHEWELSASLAQSISQTQRRLAQLTVQVTATSQSVERAAVEVAQVEEQLREKQGATRNLLAQAQQADARFAELTQQAELDKNEHMECMRQTARLQNDAVSYKAQVDNFTRERSRLQQRSEQAAESLASIDVELEELTQGEEALAQRYTNSRETLEQLRQQRAQIVQTQEETSHQLADLRADRSGLMSRIEVLEGLERSHEGLGAGVREVFALLEQPKRGPWSCIVGMLADFLTVRREYAPLIDIALGERAQRFLVQDLATLQAALGQRTEPFASRVSFLPLTGEVGESAETASNPFLGEGPLPEGVVASATTLVRCELPDFADLPTRLLHKTVVVQDLDSARRLASAYPGFRFVTTHGDLLEDDGTLTVGTQHAEAGILSRKSELRELREQVVEFDARLITLEQQLATLREQVGEMDGKLENQRVEIDVLNEQLTDLRTRIGRHRQRREGLHEEVELSRTEISGLEEEITKLETSWQEALAQAEESEAKVQAIHARLQAAEREMREHETQRQQRQEETVAAKVALAQVEERLAGLSEQKNRIDADYRRCLHEQTESAHHLAEARRRQTDNQRTLLRAYSILAEAYGRKDRAERLLSEGTRARDEQRRQRQELLTQSQDSRKSWRDLQEQAHARELETSNLQHQLQSLCARLQEDYQLDLKLLYEQSQQEEIPTAEVVSEDEASDADVEVLVAEDPLAAATEEINDLKKKLHRLGSVNLDALDELNELEQRAQALNIQYEDLTSAEKTLQDIIARINTDSRRLFQETFDAIRGHFQELFRKLFGGGMAEIILEDESDILESGIEVIARPPGKELRSISLMSGGEKTMTAVALLLAIFRSKPSPFCILDEVDAALDEANIGRFTAVLREFLDMSHFIIVTHSKRTMSTADVLYGITMQESGISSRISVRFEDWPDDSEQAETVA